MTLDAGGTNFVFSAIQDCEFITAKTTLPSFSDDLEKCIFQIIKGFETTKALLSEEPAAISFAFPGPADYPNGIIGGFLPNFPSFRKGVALKRILENRFNLPVFINNDADLFAYGEAMHGTLPQINRRLKSFGCTKEYKNMLGYTFGNKVRVRIRLRQPAAYRRQFMRRNILPQEQTRQQSDCRKRCRRKSHNPRLRRTLRKAAPRIRAKRHIRHRRRHQSRQPRRRKRSIPAVRRMRRRRNGHGSLAD